MKDLKKTYTDFHVNQNPVHIYPTEWIIRTMLGKYPEMVIDKNYYLGANILDMGFGDGRNMPLFKNIGLNIYGVEISDEIINKTSQRLDQLNIEAILKKGSNVSIPFQDSYFDIILASGSFYYIDDGYRFEDNVKEYLRVLKKGGILIANFPERERNTICKNHIDQGDGHVIIKNDPHGLRNGYVYRVFNSKKEVAEYFDSNFNSISIGYGYEEYYGYELSMFFMVAYKK